MSTSKLGTFCICDLLMGVKDGLQFVMEQATTYGNEVLHIPHVLGAIGFFHSIPSNVNAGKEVNLTPTLLAKIFQREIKEWDHEDIKAINPDLSVPAGQKITVYHRRLGSSSTHLISEYLAGAAADVWKLGVNKVLTWPAGKHTYTHLHTLTHTYTHVRAHARIDVGPQLHMFA